MEKQMNSQNILIAAIAKEKNRRWSILAGAMIFILVLIVILIMVKKAPAESPAEERAKPVQAKVQAVSESWSLDQVLKFPAIVQADEEASIVAKSAGTVKAADFSIGDRVAAGQELVRIDDVGTGNDEYAAGFSAAQVRQAVLAVEQAEAAYSQAAETYNKALVSSQRDLEQLAIAKEQAAQGKNNLDLTTESALKSAELAYQTARTASEQAKLNLEDRRTIAGQSAEDARTNGEVAADGAISASGNIITLINNMLGLDEVEIISIPYKNNLGVLDTDSFSGVKGQYQAAKALFEELRGAIFSDTGDKLDRAISLAEATRRLADAARLVLDKSVTSNDLPQSSVTGVSLGGLQAQVSGFQSQLAAVLAQVNGAKQGLSSIDLGNDANLTALEKAYEIAQVQEALAKQNLENLKAGNKAQIDNAAFGVSAADNQYESLAIKLDSQIAQYRTQMTMAEIAYRNAQSILQNAYDSHLGVAPISGVVTKKLVSVGDTVSPGQILAVVSETARVVLNFYVDRETVGLIKNGQPVTITYNGNQPIAGHIASVSLLADDLTKRFLAEAQPEKTDPGIFALGSIMDVNVILKKTVQGGNSIILPIAAVNVGQNETSIFIFENGQAKAIPVLVKRVEGEAVELQTDLGPEALIIVSNNKLLSDGSAVEPVH